VELNCSFWNELFGKVAPMWELELSFDVQSWTQLRKTAIIIELEHVAACAVEPLQFLDCMHPLNTKFNKCYAVNCKKKCVKYYSNNNKSNHQSSQQQQQQQAANSKATTINHNNKKAAGNKKTDNPADQLGVGATYNIIDCIIDNLTIGIQSFSLDYQPWVKFKTK